MSLHMKQLAQDAATDGQAVAWDTATTAFIPKAVILPAGTVPFTGDQAMGGHKITGLAAPGAGGDAATKTYVDTTVAGGAPPTGAAGGDLGGSFPNPTVAKASQAFALTGVLSPASLGADQNNYNPATLSTAAVLRLTSSVNVNITGLAGGSVGREMVIHNVGANNITLKNLNGGSTAANQFTLGADAVLTPNQSLALIYDATTSAWRSQTTGSGGTGGGGAPTVVSQAVSFGATGSNKLYVCDATGGAITATLPAASAAAILWFKKTDAGGNTVTVARAGGDTIDGGTSKIISIQNDVICVVSDGVSAWYVI